MGAILRRVLILSLSALAAAACSPRQAAEKSDVDRPETERIAAEAPAAAPQKLRIATFNAALNRSAEGALVAELEAGGSAQIAAVANIIAEVDPDILLVNEIDRDEAGRAATLFQALLAKSGAAYDHVYFGPVNTGVASGFDLDRDGKAVATPGAPGYGGDAFGFGAFPGQYALAVFSRHPIDMAKLRTFQTFLWKDMPGALLPDDPSTDAPGDWLAPEALAAFRLSSKSHWDVPVKIGDQTLHVLASHPTPPAFDGPEARNKRRNHDEIRFWADYVSPDRAAYIYDDSGGRGGLGDGARFVILGDLNADPNDGASWPGAANQLLAHARIAAGAPESAGAAAAAARQAGANLLQKGDPRTDTSDFNDKEGEGPGNLRVDYVLPSRAGMKLLQSGVFWPAPETPQSALIGEGWPVVSSDHRLVWIDVEIAP